MWRCCLCGPAVVRASVQVVESSRRERVAGAWSLNLVIDEGRWERWYGERQNLEDFAALIVGKRSDREFVHRLANESLCFSRTIGAVPVISDQLCVCDELSYLAFSQ